MFNLEGAVKQTSQSMNEWSANYIGMLSDVTANLPHSLRDCALNRSFRSADTSVWAGRGRLLEVRPREEIFGEEETSGRDGQI